MKKTSDTIVFFGSGPVAAASLKFIIEHFAIEAVITKAVPAHHKELAPVEELAKSKGLTLFFASTKQELDELISAQDFRSRLGLIVDYGVIVSQQTIGAFELGIINSHFSLLPQWRGADPISFAILSGQPKTGVSLMLIEPSLDTGKLLVQKGLVIKPGDTTSSLTERLVKLSNLLLANYLPKYIIGDISPRNQPHPVRATYSRKLTKDDGIIDWFKPAEQIEREIRAFIDWPKSRANVGDKEVIITKAHVVDKMGSPGQQSVENKLLLVFTGEKALVIDKLKPAGKNEMTAQAFLAGNKLL